MLLQPQPTSPFPSPSSSFVPPPAQEAHEFANKTTARMAAAKQPRSGSHSRRNSREDKHDSPQPQPQPLPPPTPTLKRFSADSSHSLASSRPAPASPALSRHSSLLHTGSKKRLSTLSIVSTSTPPPALTPRSVPIKIRDFAYSFDDDRHHGKWPYSNRDSIQGDDDSSSEGYFGPGYEERDCSEDEEEEEEEDEQPFVPGIYRAMYAFEPEGTAEMALAEDQHVRVLGRGGGVGWVVVLKTDGDEPEQALVPEGYLALVRADTELDDDDEDESVSATEAPQTPRALS